MWHGWIGELAQLFYCWDSKGGDYIALQLFESASSCLYGCEEDMLLLRRRGNKPVKKGWLSKTVFVWKEFFSNGRSYPNYLGDIDAPYRIKEYVPLWNISISLCGPVERLYSNFMMFARNGRETRPFLEALQRSYFAKTYIGFLLYAASITLYWELFRKEQVMIVIWKRLKRTPRLLSIVSWRSLVWIRCHSTDLISVP